MVITLLIPNPNPDPGKVNSRVQQRRLWPTVKPQILELLHQAREFMDLAVLFMSDGKMK